MSIVTTLIPDRRDLSTQALAQLGLCSIVLPELPGADDLDAFFSVASEAQVEAWAFEDGGALEYCVGSAQTIAEFYASNNFKNLLSIDSNRTGVWVPQDHNFYVVFGLGATLGRLHKLSMFDFKFEEYIDEPYHSEKSKRYLLHVLCNYSVGNVEVESRT